MSMGVTASQALARLKEGHGRYLMGCGGHVHTDAARRKETCEGGQHPFAVILGCSDSRVPVEIIFDQGVGDLFVVRVPGNVCNPDEIGAIEYGVEHLKAPLCVVFGHTQCGAVTAVTTGAAMEGHLASLVECIRPVAECVRREHPELSGAQLIEMTARANVERSIESLLAASPIVRERIERGELQVVGAIYDLATGAIEWR